MTKFRRGMLSNEFQNELFALSADPLVVGVGAGLSGAVFVPFVTRTLAHSSG